MQELSFKSKPNVWAYFSVKVNLSWETSCKISSYISNLMVIEIMICSLEEAFMNSQILNLVSFSW